MRTRAGHSAALNGQVVAVTGAAKGIGREIARSLALAGAHVGLGDLDGDAARATAAALNSEIAGLSAGAVEAFELDVTDTASFAAFLADVESRWGPIGVLVNNAGVMWVGSFDAEPEDATRRQLEVTLPAYVGPLTRLAEVLPQRARDFLYRAMLPDQVAAVAGTTARDTYEARLLSDNSPTPGES
ncbi:SDR family NAD(P)-dependent oxidoreductase [Nocardia sp. A7]|uniref:SDR family NAD(P)-dependent oxidoreductase n=1 Tax=Nocardia sp. A7 TaxID=2789274 RepID=UPI0039788756